MKTFFLICLFLAGSTAYSAPVCFTNKATYDAVKSGLPSFMRQGQVFLAYTDKSLTAAAAIVPSGTGFSFKLDYEHSLLGTTNESGKIRQVCYENGTAVVTLNSGASKTLKVQGSSLIYKGYSLPSVSKQKYLAILGKVLKTAGSGSDEGRNRK
ncbi:MAG TPA: hypothetical protein PL182_14085 [Pseudobdellovibrionaceae bacterium]|nr:hypothetical protein [Pseudobdellovibrionaceae bacterium]